MKCPKCERTLANCNCHGYSDEQLFGDQQKHLPSAGLAGSTASAPSSVELEQWLIRTEFEITPRVFLTQFLFEDELAVLAQYPADKYTIIGPANKFLVPSVEQG